MLPLFHSLQNLGWKMVFKSVETMRRVNNTLGAQRDKVIEESVADRHSKDTLGLTNEQFAILQKMSGHYLLRKEEMDINVPEIGAALKHLFEQPGSSWEWFPLNCEGKKLMEEVKRNPEHFELLYTPEDSNENQWEYNLVNLGIRSKENGIVIRRAVLDVYVKKTEEDIEKYLEELSKI